MLGEVEMIHFRFDQERDNIIPLEIWKCQEEQFPNEISIVTIVHREEKQ